jgi:hypothetical protein
MFHLVLAIDTITSQVKEVSCKKTVVNKAQCACPRGPYFRLLLFALV